MADNIGASTNGGIGALSLLGIVFVRLKLTGYIDWSWWWVTAPFWGVFAMVAVISIVLAVVYGLVLASEKRVAMKHQRLLDD